MWVFFFFFFFCILTIFSFAFSFLSYSLWETSRYRLKYYLKAPLKPNQPTNHSPLHKRCFGVNLSVNRPWLKCEVFLHSKIIRKNVHLIFICVRVKSIGCRRKGFPIILSTGPRENNPKAPKRTVFLQL